VRKQFDKGPQLVLYVGERLSRSLLLLPPIPQLFFMRFRERLFLGAKKKHAPFSYQLYISSQASFSLKPSFYFAVMLSKDSETFRRSLLSGGFTRAPVFSRSSRFCLRPVVTLVQIVSPWRVNSSRSGWNSGFPFSSNR